MGKMRLSLIDSDFYIEVPFKAGLTVYLWKDSQVMMI
jgi:hypothetical protein